jgi:antitoxin HicB
MDILAYGAWRRGAGPWQIDGPLGSSHYKAALGDKELRMLIYHYTLVPDDNGTLLIRFPDVPEAAAVAETEAEVPVQAVDGLEAALA